MAEPRALSFGARADVYARVRPTPPPALVDDLVALLPARVLDVGCGTGKVASALAARGLDVLGVERDPRMAALAPVPVELSAFEDWDALERTFDLVVCADAWHWLDPGRAEAKLAAVCTGTFVRIWNSHELDEPLRGRLDEISERLAPEVRPVGHFYGPEDESRDETRVYDVNTEIEREDWLALVSTYSGHQALGPERLAALLDAFRAELPPVVPARLAAFTRWRAMPR